MSTLLIIITLALLVIFFFGVRFYSAELTMAQQQGVSSQELIKNLEKGVNLNPYRSRYRITLSQSYLIGSILEARQPLQEQDSQILRNYVAKSIEQARQATRLSPNLVNTWENLGIIYRDLRILATGADTWAIDSFRKALELEPNNPVFYAEMGKIYLAGVTSPADEDKINQAIEQFQKAVELKSDYLDPQIQIALTEEKKGNIEEAIKKLEGLLIGQPLVSPAQIEALFQLGRLYFNSGRVDNAINAFQIVIRFVPNHSNAHYALGVAYQQKGMKEQALAEFQIVLGLNPGNEEIRRRIEELRR